MRFFYSSRMWVYVRGCACVCVSQNNPLKRTESKLQSHTEQRELYWSALVLCLLVTGYSTCHFFDKTDSEKSFSISFLLDFMTNWLEEHWIAEQWQQESTPFSGDIDPKTTPTNMACNHSGGAPPLRTSLLTLCCLLNQSSSTSFDKSAWCWSGWDFASGWARSKPMSF